MKNMMTSVLVVVAMSLLGGYGKAFAMTDDELREVAESPPPYNYVGGAAYPKAGAEGSAICFLAGSGAEGWSRPGFCMDIKELAPLISSAIRAQELYDTDNSI